MIDTSETEWTIEDWKTAYEALTSQYNNERRRAEKAEAGVERVREKASAASLALMDYYNILFEETNRELNEQIAALTKRCTELETMNKAQRRLS